MSFFLCVCVCVCVLLLGMGSELVCLRDEACVWVWAAFLDMTPGNELLVTLEDFVLCLFFFFFFSD